MDKLWKCEFFLSIIARQLLLWKTELSPHFLNKLLGDFLLNYWLYSTIPGSSELQMEVANFRKGDQP